MDERTFFWGAGAVAVIGVATIVGMASRSMTSLFNKQADAINRAVEDINGVRPVAPLSVPTLPAP